MNPIEDAVPTPRILVTGVTGYVGGRLVPRLLEAGYRVRVLVRGGPERLKSRPWRDQVEIVTGDVLVPESLGPALQGVQAAYYLVHSMGGNRHFHQRDLTAAENFARAAAAAEVAQIVYLGGLGNETAELSEHLRSRHETGVALRASGVPVTEFRAGMVVGSGSISFEMLRHLTERLPAMICPRWVFTRTQPIAIRDVLSYLLAALQTPEARDRIIEIGGADILPYADMIRIYARIRGLHRLLIPVPFLSPGSTSFWVHWSSYWVHWVTPVPAAIARPLIQGLPTELLVRDPVALQIFPAIRPLTIERAMELAVDRMNQREIETLWSDALASSQGDLGPVYLTQEQGMLIERRERTVQAPAQRVYQVFAGIGGERGWPPFNWLWTLRGILDRLVGGPGMRRGRRHPDELRVGEALDFWRVEAVEPDHMILLRAEMKLPGQGWLRFRARPGAEPGSTVLVQTAFFDPKGVFGLLYWYGLYPMHKVVFSRMIEWLAEMAEQ